MFFKKRAEVKKAAIAATRKETIEGFLKAYIAAEDTPDVGERLLELEKTKNAIQRELVKTSLNIQNRTENTRSLVGIGSILSIGTISMCLVTTNPLLAVGLAAGTLVSFPLSYKSKKIVEKKLQTESKDYIGCLESQKKLATDGIQKILTGPLEPIARSSRHVEVLRQYPDLSARFAEVAAKNMQTKSLPAPSLTGQKRHAL